MKYLLCCLSFTFFINSANAAVNFITDESAQNRKGLHFQSSDSQDCINNGYNKTACNEHSYLYESCPYNKKYYRSCCPKSFMYSQEECKAQGKQATSRSCAGKFGCY